ncbi:MAG: cobalamin biosynthesis protein [Eubacteriales bacterium]|nr:cobalamin biosynthesis protein [Eubacteriales bacterium]
MKISVISFTRAGAVKNLELVRILQENHHQAVSYSWHKYTGRRLIPFKSLKLLFQDLWENQEVFLFLWDMEHVAGAVMPWLKEKGQGPAVFVMDEDGKFVIPFSMGKTEGMQEWCTWFARLVNAAAVITSPLQREERFLADVFARKNQLHIQDIFRIRTIAEKLFLKEPVGIYSDYPIDGVLPEGLVGVGSVMNGDKPGITPDLEVGISITDDWEAPHFAKECRMFPCNLVLGIVCPEDVEVQNLQRFAVSVLAQNHLSKERVCGLFSVRELADEKGLRMLADRLDIPFFTYKKEQMSSEKQELSEMCESCASLGSGRGKKLVGCREQDGVYLAVYEKDAKLSF